jgi:predicted ester cyclase
VEGIDFFHLADGKIAEVWIAFDNAAILQAVGAVPEI